MLFLLDFFGWVSICWGWGGSHILNSAEISEICFFFFFFFSGVLALRVWFCLILFTSNTTSMFISLNFCVQGSKYAQNSRKIL